MSQDNSDKSDRKAVLIKLLKDFSAVMFITLSDDGQIGLRPMQVVKSSEDGVLWFVTSRDSEKVADAKQQDAVYISGQSGDSVFIAARGRPEFYSDNETKERLWSETMRVWFPKGLEDPNLCFIKVTITEGEYWNTAGLHKLSYVFESLRAYMSGTTPALDSKEQHGRVDL